MSAPSGCRALLLWLVLLAGLSGCSVLKVNHQLTLRSYARLSIVAQKRDLAAGPMRYYAGGQGFPVLFIHGFGFTALENWEHQVGSFVPVYRVLAPDLYWFGDSVPRSGVAMDTAEAQADAISELLGRLSVCKVHVVGVSYGGFVAMELALRHPEQVSKLVLVDAAGLQVTPAERAQVSARFGGTQDVTQVLIPGDVSALRRFLHTVFYRPRWIPALVLRQILHDEFWKNRDAKRRMLQQLQDGGPLREERLQAITAETLILWGRHDPLIPPSLAERLVRSIPGARLQFMEESAHSPMLEEPARFNRAILDFLSAPQQGRR